jgi:hypothetical protein
MQLSGWIERSFFKDVNSCPLGIRLSICLVDPISVYLCEVFELPLKIIRPEESFPFHDLTLFQLVNVYMCL